MSFLLFGFNSTIKSIMTLVFVDIPIKIRHELDQRIADAFKMYDFVGNSMVANCDLPRILRFLGCVPSDQDVAEIVQECEFTDIKGAVHLSRFLVVLVDMLEQNRMRPADIEELQEAFKLLDPRGRMYLSEEELMEALIESNDAELLTEDEKFEMRRTMVERPSDICWYEKYIYKLWSDPADSIYEQAKVNMLNGEVRKSEVRRKRSTLRT